MRLLNILTYTQNTRHGVLGQVATEPILSPTRDLMIVIFPVSAIVTALETIVFLSLPHYSHLCSLLDLGVLLSEVPHIFSSPS